MFVLRAANIMFCMEERLGIRMKMRDFCVIVVYVVLLE
jgi:hypothetical protein